MGVGKRIRWSEELIEAGLREAAVKVGGRMPSCEELKAMGFNALGCKVSRTGGGFRGWAERLGLKLKDSETSFGQQWEDYIEEMLSGAGHAVERQTARAPFDLLVDGLVRVNVKAARYTAINNAHVFGLNTSWRHCDVFALVKVDGSEVPLVLWVPARKAQQQSIGLTPKHRFNRYTSMAPLAGRKRRTRR